MRLIAATLMAAASSSTLAHPGHDHNHWLSEPTHIILAVSIAAVVIVSAMFLGKVLKVRQQEGEK